LRIRELRQRGATATEAIAGGITRSAGVVTSAAVIMVAVFSIFASPPSWPRRTPARYQVREREVAGAAVRSE
jgi:hypothetical protein